MKKTVARVTISGGIIERLKACLLILFTGELTVGKIQVLDEE